MTNQPFDGDRPNIPLLTALSARFTLTELYSLYSRGIGICVYWYPDGKSGRARIWRGCLDQRIISTIRRLQGAVKGRDYVFDDPTQGPPSWVQHDDCAASREDEDRRRLMSQSLPPGFDCIRTFKWTTDATTRRRIPPNSKVYRDLYSGKVYVRLPV